MDLQADFIFAAADGWRQAPTLRYVAAINAGCTKKQFIAEAVKAGYNSNTAAIQFAQSRRFDVDSYGLSVDPEGRLIDKNP